MIEAGFGLKDVASRLGHVSVRMADSTYVELFEDRGRRIAEALDRLARGPDADQMRTTASANE